MAGILREASKMFMYEKLFPLALGFTQRDDLFNQIPVAARLIIASFIDSERGRDARTTQSTLLPYPPIIGNSLGRPISVEEWKEGFEFVSKQLSMSQVLIFNLDFDSMTNLVLAGGSIGGVYSVTDYPGSNGMTFNFFKVNITKKHRNFVQ